MVEIGKMFSEGNKRLTSVLEVFTLRLLSLTVFILQGNWKHPVFQGAAFGPTFAEFQLGLLKTRSMSKREPPSKEAFDKLLLWLNPDRDHAGEKYEKIRLRLIRIFACRGCYEAEDLADETINVVASKIDWLLENFQGEPALYFYAVAKKIHLEQLKKKPPPEIPPPEPAPPELEETGEYLEQCLQELSGHDRDLILRYHQGEKQVKIQNRKRLAAELKISRNALRIKVCHLHLRLRKCVEAHLKLAA